MDHHSAAAMSALGATWLIIAIVILAMTVLRIWGSWIIFTKAGYNGWLTLLNFVPFGDLIMIGILAFGRWPMEDRLAALQGHSPMPRPSAP